MRRSISTKITGFNIYSESDTLLLTNDYIYSGTSDCKADIITHRHVNAKRARVIERVSQNELALS